jgi:hypothetical protein
LLGNDGRKGRRKTNPENGLATLERCVVGCGDITHIDLLVGFVGGTMEEIDQRNALGISLKAFAILMVIVCFIYQTVTRSANLVDLWFSYLVGLILYALGSLMTSRLWR